MERIGRVLKLGLEEQGRDREAGHAAEACGNGGSALSRMDDVSAFPEHVACSEVGKVGSELGQIWAESDIMPKTKFDLHGLLYNFHLGTMVIRAVD